ncbi:MAG: hypothetical protein B6242_11805 [Anaerolineaceae bacterium 4572_78]|nr:MAG: hypothetical protein B6242_11805 [Anaerolineaceae bacterium 4572_78]
MLNFRDCTLVLLEEKFGLIPDSLAKSDTLHSWLDGQADILDWEKLVLSKLQYKLILNVHDWNEAELMQNFIGPVFALVDYTTNKFNLFGERKFGGMVDGIEMSGKPDGMIASGFRLPEKPYFCFQEYKRFKDPEGDPAGQCLAPMLVAQEINEHKHPIYGCHVIGNVWYFMVLEGKSYTISMGHLATREDIFEIFCILKVLKEIITDLVGLES